MFYVTIDFGSKFHTMYVFTKFDRQDSPHGVCVMRNDTLFKDYLVSQRCKLYMRKSYAEKAAERIRHYYKYVCPYQMLKNPSIKIVEIK